jgi:hypothetical protein
MLEVWERHVSAVKHEIIVVSKQTRLIFLRYMAELFILVAIYDDLLLFYSGISKVGLKV